MSDIIRKKTIFDLIDAEAWEYCDYLIRYKNGEGQEYASHMADNIRERIKEAPSLSEKEGVRIIWQHQIDDLIKEIKAESLGKWYTGRIDGKTDEVVLLKDVIDILEEAKK